MKLRVLAALTAALTLTAAMPALPAVYAEDSYDMTVAVDLNADKKAISPYIYGINDAGKLDDVTVTAVRQGGNRYSAYNWENNYSNAGADWKNNSDTYLVNNYTKEEAKTPGACALDLSKQCQNHGIDYKMATIQMAGYVSADADGPVTEEEAAPSNRWKEVKATKSSEFSLEPDTTDDYVYMDEYVNYLVNKLGDASTKTGINGYNLDNEPGLWNSTHKLMHPDQPTYKEMVEKSTEYAAAIKAVDPKAEVFGLALFGVYSYYNFCGAPDQDTSYDWFLSYYLDKMKDAETAAGKRLIDAIDVHYYSEAKGDARVTENNATSDKDKAARVQAPRTLYEEGYYEDSWLTESDCKNYMPYLKTIQKSIDTYYPGTKLAMTEYNFGGGMDVTGAIAEADALGAFAANDVYLATLWPLTDTIDYQLSAIDLYTNYDGKGSSFGDTLVSAKTDDWEKSYAYASIDGSDTSTVTVVLANKDADKSEKATLDIKGGKDYKSAVVYAVTGDHSDIRVIDVQNDLSGAVTVTLPPYSVATVVLSDKATDATEYVEPEKTTKEVTFQYDELKDGKDGKIIPISDAAHLKEVIIDVTASSNAGSSWYCGGGALCFNSLSTADGSVWAAKDFMYSGSGEVKVKFDGTFKIADPDGGDDMVAIEGTITEDSMIMQDWWKSSEKSDSGEDVQCTYNSVTLVYDYAGEEIPTDATDDTKPADTTETKPADTTEAQETTVPMPAKDLEQTFKFEDLTKDKDGNYVVPIDDASKLTAVVINTTAECASNTTWFGGGGGICFSQLVAEDGTKFWGYKDFQYASGTGDVTVKIDGKFMKPVEGADSEEVSATIADKQLIVQDWWKATAEDETGADVSVTYNTITLVYGGGAAQADTTETTTAAPSGNTVYGDVNEDGAVDIMDVIALNKFLLGASTLGEQGKANADVDVNNAVDTTDSLNILKCVVEIISAADFPIK